MRHISGRPCGPCANWSYSRPDSTILADIQRVLSGSFLRCRPLTGSHTDRSGPMQRARPVARVKTGPARSREKERAWAHVPWWHSAIFVVAVVVMAVAVNSGLNSRPSRTAATDGITFRITDAGSGLPLSGATVSIGGQSLTSGVDGTVKVPVAPVEQDVTVQYPGYQTMYGRASANSPSSLACCPAHCPDRDGD